MVTSGGGSSPTIAGNSPALEFIRIQQEKEEKRKEAAAAAAIERQKRAAEQQQKSEELARKAQKQRAAQKQAYEAMVARFLATDYAQRLTSACMTKIEYQDTHGEPLLPSEKVKLHQSNIVFEDAQVSVES